jgi:hypothetical protein
MSTPQSSAREGELPNRWQHGILVALHASMRHNLRARCFVIALLIASAGCKSDPSLQLAADDGVLQEEEPLLLAPPAPPEQISVYGGNQRVRVLFSHPAPANKRIQIDRCDGASEADCTRVADRPALEFLNPTANLAHGDRPFKYVDVDATLVPERAYRYRLRALSKSGPSASDWVDAPSVTVFRLTLAATEETLYDSRRDRDRCSATAAMFPDLPVRALRGADDRVQLILPYFHNYRMIGPSFDHLSVDCQPILGSPRAGNAQPSDHNDCQWLSAVHTVDGRTIFGIIYNEYHLDPLSDPRWPTAWHMSLTAAISHDGGQTYEHLAPAPSHLIAGIPYRYDPQLRGVTGIAGPSNLYQDPRDGHVYFNALMMPAPGSPSFDRWGTCMMRFDPNAGAFRFFDGKGFDGVFVDAYGPPVADPEAHVCRRIAHESLNGMTGSLVWSTVFERPMMIGYNIEYDPSRPAHQRGVSGIYLALGDELSDFEHRELVMETPLGFGKESGVVYAGLIDHGSPSRNFDIAGRTPFLYYTRWIKDADGVVVAVTLSRRRVEISVTP